MKKTILSFLLIGSAGLAIAQQQPATSNPDKTKINNGNTNTNLNNTQPTNPNTTYPQSTNVPPTNQPPTNMNTTADSAVMADPSYPATNNALNNAAISSSTYEVNVPVSIKASFKTSYPDVTTNRWHQSGDWYVARYVENGQIRQVSYREDGKILNAVMSPVRKSFVPDEIVNQAIQKYGANLYAVGSSKGTDGQEMYHVTLIENGQSRTEWMNADGSTSDNHFRKADEEIMSVNEGNMNMQEQTEVTSQDSTVSQPEVTDPTPKNDERTEPQPEHSHPRDHNQDEGSNSSNQEGLNNASEINASPKRF